MSHAVSPATLRATEAVFAALQPLSHEHHVMDLIFGSLSYGVSGLLRRHVQRSQIGATIKALIEIYEQREEGTP